MDDFGENVVDYVDYEEHRLVTIDLEDDVVVHVDDPVDHRLADHNSFKNGLGEDVVVQVHYEEHRLVTIDLEDDVVHVDYPDQRLVTIDLGEDVELHMD